MGVGSGYRKTGMFVILMVMMQVMLSFDCAANPFPGRQADSVYAFVPKMPQFPGGGKELSEYISKHAILPEQEYYQGYFLLSFIVCKDGKLTAVGIKDKTPETWTAAEAAMVKMIKRMPDWIPGEIKGKKVTCQYYLPLHICPQD